MGNRDSTVTRKHAISKLSGCQKLMAIEAAAGWSWR
jgi:hypothetical protein